ncbi:MAG TPA: TIGR02588 family protein [Trichocoleus sp.]
MRSVGEPRLRLHRQQPIRISAESVTLAIASLIVAILVALIILIWVTESNEDPIIAITRDRAIQEARGQYYVPFTVINEGGKTAEAVAIVAELKINGQVEETGEQEIDFLSSQEKEEGVFIFKRDPQAGELTIRASGYKLP